MTTADRKLVLGALAETAHDLRAPLGGIEAMAQLLRDTALSPDQERMVTGLLAAAAHLRAVASDIIDEARGVAPSSSEHRASAFSIQDLFASVRTAAEARAAAKRLAFNDHMDPALPAALVGDPRRIRQMLENLLDNAFKVTGSGGVSVTIRLVDRRGAFAGLRFEVRDTGPGIAPENVDRLFHAFSSVESGVPGSGLGLSLVARMARAMGGDAGYAPNNGGGALFWFTLRLKVPDAAAGADSAAAAPASDLPVLVIDDNQANRVIMTAILEHFGHRVVDACSGEDALVLLSRTPVKAVMLDQTLPGVSGLDLLRTLRAMGGDMARLPIIPVTGRVAPEDKAAFAAAGANGFVEKPVNARAIRDALTEALASAQPAQSAA